MIPAKYFYPIKFPSTNVIKDSHPLTTTSSLLSWSCKIRFINHCINMSCQQNKIVIIVNDQFRLPHDTTIGAHPCFTFTFFYIKSFFILTQSVIGSITIDTFLYGHKKIILFIRSAFFTLNTSTLWSKIRLIKNVYTAHTKKNEKTWRGFTLTNPLQL